MKFFKFFGSFLFLIAPASALAHVGYVVTKEEMNMNRGGDGLFLLSVFSEPKNAILMLVTIALVVIFAVFTADSKIIKNYATKVRAKLKSYEELLPWIARLSLGIALLGAGLSGNLISPILPTIPAVSLIEIYVGFFLLAGFLVVLMLAISLGLFAIALISNLYIVGNFDFVALVLAILALGSARPGVDDIFGISLLHRFGLPRKWLMITLRTGISVAMMFLALYEKLLNPHLSELVVTNYHLTNYVHVSPAMWIFGAGIVEFLIGAALFIGYRTRIVSAIAFLVVCTTFFFFKESVYAHVTLFGILSMLFILGDDKEKSEVKTTIKKKRVLRKIKTA